MKKTKKLAEKSENSYKLSKNDGNIKQFSNIK